MNDFQTIEQQFAALFSLVEDDETFSALDQNISSWSVGDQVTHVALALRAMGTNVRKALMSDAVTESTGPNKMGAFILKNGFIPRGKAQAPEFVHPKGVSSRVGVTADLEQAHSQWEEIYRRKDEIESSESVVPHQILGDFTADLWVRFACIHTQHHLKIIFDILDDTGIPVPEKVEIIRTNSLELKK